MAEKKMKFQDAMNRLDEIVTLLNNSSLELEEAMKYFEEGLALSKQCEKQLKEFENKMDQLMVAKENDDEVGIGIVVEFVVDLQDVENGWTE